MFASVSYGQIRSRNRGDSCRSSVLTVKETYHDRQIQFSVLSDGEPSFLDLQEIGGVDGRGMVLDLLFSWISIYFLVQNCCQGFRSWLRFLYSVLYGATRPLFVRTWSCPTSSAPKPKPLTSESQYYSIKIHVCVTTIATSQDNRCHSTNLLLTLTNIKSTHKHTISALLALSKHKYTKAY